MPTNLTAAQATEAYRAICADLGVAPQPGYQTETPAYGVGGPQLVKGWDWYSHTAWAVVWEEGPFEWSYYVDREMPTSVFMEPITTWSLGLYRA